MQKMITKLFSRPYAAFRALCGRLRRKQAPEAVVDTPTPAQEEPGVRYIVVDLEWNQYPKWIKTPVSGKGVVMPHEIIQIGAIKVDQDFNPIDAFSVGVRLQGRRKLSKHVARVIQKTQEEIDQGYDFPEAYAFFTEWSAGAECFITWGRDDFRVLENNLAYYELGALDANLWYDAQLMFASQVRGDRVQTSLANAAMVLGVEDSLAHHDALNDAYITVGVCGHLDMQKGFADEKKLPAPPHTQEKKSENQLFLHKKFRSASSEGGFETRAQAKQQCEAMQLFCPTCKNVMKLEPSRVSSGDRWMRMAVCQAHGKHLIRYRVRHRTEGAFFWSQTIYAPDLELEHYYRDKVVKKQKRRSRPGAKPAAKKKPVLPSAASGQN